MIDIIGLMMLAEGEPKPHRRRTEATCGAPVAHFGVWVGPFQNTRSHARRDRRYCTVGIRSEHHLDMECPNGSFEPNGSTDGRQVLSSVDCI